MPAPGYTFGDSGLAARRLALLAEVFAPATSAFLARLAPPGGCGLAVDLGCGPGFTTALLGDAVCPARLVAVEQSEAFSREAAARLGARAEVVVGDVTALPPAVTRADLIFARFLLTHLPDPAAALAHWLTRLAPGGYIATEEVESITTDEPVLADYLALQREMLAGQGHRLEAGPLIERAAREHGWAIHSEIATLSPDTADAARLFAMNFAGWRERPEVRERDGLDQIAAGLDALAEGRRGGGAISWELRQLMLGA